LQAQDRVRKEVEAKQKAERDAGGLLHNPFFMILVGVVGAVVLHI
jgi:hypothetical protein